MKNKTTQRRKNKFNLAFTLAEILIVLSLIGLVADMTIPVLMQNTKNKITIVKLKKAHSVLEQVFKLAEIDNGPRAEWNISTAEAGAFELLAMLSPYMLINKTCTEGYNTNKCLPMGTYKDLNGKSAFVYEPGKDPASIAIILNDGTSIGFSSFQFSSTCDSDIGIGHDDVCGDIYVDINGPKKPNQYGVDLFNFIITKNSLVPRGAVDNSPLLNLGFKTACNKNSDNNANGIACAAWVIQNENMDYLKCNDLSWDGKRSCEQ